jgi:tight adherence protein B
MIRSRLARVGVLAFLLALVGAVPALAQATDPGTGTSVDGSAEAEIPTEILLVDATRDAQGYAVLRTGSVPRSALVTVNGATATIDEVAPLSAAEPADRTPTGQSVMFVLDNADTGRTDTVAQLELAKDAIREVIVGLPTGTRIGLVTTGGGANLWFAFRSDLDAVLDALDRVTPAGQSALWDAVKLGASRFADDEGRAVGSMVVVPLTAEVESSVGYDAARGEVIAQDLEAHVIGLASGGIPGSELRALTSLSGGTYQEAATHEALQDLAPAVAASVGNTYLLAFSSSELQANGDLRIQLDASEASATYVPGSITRGAALAVQVEVGEGVSGPFSGTKGLLLGVGLAALAAGLLTWAVVVLVQKPKSDLAEILQVYAQQSGGEIAPEVRMALLQRAVQATETFAARQGILAKTEARLEAADMPLRAGEALTFQLGIVAGAGLLGLLGTRNLLLTVALVLAGILLPPMIVDLKAKKRRKRFEEQLPDMLTLLASTLKAGYSFMQGVEAVSREVDGPMGQELRRVVTEAQLGRPVEEALSSSAERMQSLDFAWAVMAVGIQREVGGNLAEILLTVADTMVARNRLRGEVKALTAEGKVSAVVLGLLPLGLGVVMFVINPDYMGLLFSDMLGRIMLGLGILGMLVGFLWMKKIITIEI